MFLIKYMMAGFELGSSGIGSNCSPNCGITTAQIGKNFEKYTVLKLSCTIYYTRESLHKYTFQNLCANLSGWQLQLRQQEDGFRILPSSGHAKPHKVDPRLRCADQEPQT